MPATFNDLERLERQVAEFRQSVRKQLERIARLKHDGYPTEGATMLLIEYQEAVRVAEQHREAIKQKLGKSQDA
jgi:hypothetical protein